MTDRKITTFNALCRRADAMKHTLQDILLIPPTHVSNIRRFPEPYPPEPVGRRASLTAEQHSMSENN